MTRSTKRLSWFWFALVAASCCSAVGRTGEDAGQRIAQAPKHALLDLPATLAAVREVRVAARVPGQLVEVPFDVGIEVTAGQVLARVDRTSYELEYKVTLALVERARAMIAAEESQGKLHDAQLVESAAEVRQALAQRNLYEQKARRMRELHKAKAVDDNVADEAETQFQLAADRVLQMQAKQKSLEQERPQHRLTAAKAELACVEAQRDLAKYRLDSTETRAPVSGKVLAKHVEQGESISSVTTSDQKSSICVIADLSQLDAVVEVPVNSIVQVAQGQKCLVRVNDSKVVYKGEVVRVNLAVSPAAQTVTTRIRIDLPKGDRMLRPGMLGKVEILGRD